MKRWKILSLLVLVMLFTPFRQESDSEIPEPEPAPEAVAADLWRRALDIYRRNSSWYPRKIVVLSEILNRHGNPYSLTEMFFDLRLDDQGRVRTKLERALKNGEDRTEKMKADIKIRDPRDGMEPGGDGTYSVSISDSPFDPDRQDAVSFTPGEEIITIFGHSCRRFDFSYRTRILRKGRIENLTWTGMAWLEEGSGMPVKVEFALAPLPARIRSLWTIYLYDTASPDHWVLRKVMIAGHGGFLFIKKRFRTITTLDDYQLPPEAPGS